MSTVYSDDEVKEFVATNLQTRLRELNMSRAELSRRSGESEQRIYQYVHGKCQITSGPLSRLAEVLDTTADWLLSKPKRISKKTA